MPNENMTGKGGNKIGDGQPRVGVEGSDSGRNCSGKSVAGREEAGRGGIMVVED